MHPVFLELGPLRLYSYGVLVALGGALSCVFLYRRREKIGFKEEDHLWLLINVMIFGGFIGGRLLYLLEYVPFSGGEFWAQAFSFSQGFSVLGAFLGVSAAIYGFCRKLNLGFLRVLDYACQIAPFWHFFGRLGCLAAGCCYGRAPLRPLPWAVTFTDPRSMAPRELLGMPLHPVQLYEGLGDLVLALFLYRFILPGVERGRFARGTVCAVYFASYAVLRFAVEFFRGDTVALGWLPITAGQAISLGLLLAAAALGAAIYRSKPCIPS